MEPGLLNLGEHLLFDFGASYYWYSFWLLQDLLVQIPIFDQEEATSSETRTSIG